MFIPFIPVLFAAMGCARRRLRLLRRLKRLPAALQRKRLLDLLRADLQREEESEDEAWIMPTLNADGRTADAEIDLETRAYEILGPGRAKKGRN